MLAKQLGAKFGLGLVWRRDLVVRKQYSKGSHREPPLS
jgi:hypothetical protein